MSEFFGFFTVPLNLSQVVRKPVYVINEQQRRRSACASVQSDQRLCRSLISMEATPNILILYLASEAEQAGLVFPGRRCPKTSFLMLWL